MYTDPSGEIIPFLIIGAAIVGAYIGGAQANGSYNPAKWDWSSGNTWGGIIGGGILGVASMGAGIAASAAIAPAAMALIQVSGGAVGGAISGFIGGIVGGAISGGGMTILPGGDGKFFSGMYKGAIVGGLSGAVLGGVIGGVTTPKSHSWLTGNAHRTPVSTVNSLSSNGVKELHTEFKSHAFQKSVDKALGMDGGPINYRAEYLHKVTSPDNHQHVWNRASVEIVAEHGKVFSLPGGDGGTSDLIQMLGNHHGRSGVFELIVRNGVLTHQRFIPGGLLTGFPNQIVPGVSGSVTPVKPWW